MDYLMDKYLFERLPFDTDPETRKIWGQRALHMVQVFDWICKYQDPSQIYENHTSFLFGELLFFLLAALTFVHAWRIGTRHVLVWFGILIHALNVENLCYWIPDMDNFWQAQGILTFFGARAPLYILIGIYHMFDYTAFVLASRLHLPWWAYGPAVGLGAVMLDMPYDIMGIKLVWWTWHDTDPNIYDRMNWVPWNSYYFHASFACSFTWLLLGSRHLLVAKEYDWKKLPREILCVFIAGTGAFWLGTIQFALLYHPLHDIFKVHSEYTTTFFLAFYAIIVFLADRQNKNPAARTGNKYWFDELACAIAIEYLFFMIAVIVSDPLNIISEGLHQPIGPCNETQKVQTPTGLVLQKQKYFCLEDYDEKYIDFHCVPGGVPKAQEPGEPLEWYAVCGTDYDNRAEYITIIWGICFLFSLIWYQVAARSGETPVDPVKIYKRKKVAEKSTENSKKLESSPLLSPTMFKNLYPSPPLKPSTPIKSTPTFVAPITTARRPAVATIHTDTPSRNLRKRTAISYKEQI
ncbi:unnamed protein product [Caenorhabditis angaria]|uniref:DUF7802 domain-containing protein n=1 Tax=Caenorhabditis angaria TaxID=860376 RepID=A0A9P1IXD9_9PELO|nr:unnamed protein product [Caenorhabditis angaria]